jgi:phosphoglycerate kinase
MKTIDHAGDLKGKKVLMRTDFDVPVGPDGNIAEKHRVERQKATIEYLLSRGARVLMIAHISAVPSFGPLMNQLQQLLGLQIRFCRDMAEAQAYWDDDGTLALLENLRSNPGEEANDHAFAQELIAGADVYVNNAFAVCHRAHASVATVPTLLPAYAGLLVQEEVDALGKFIDAPAQGKVVYIGGAKASTKAPVVRNIIGKAQYVAVGGVLANDIYKELGRSIGSSRADENSGELLAGLDLHDSRLIVPTDEVIDDGQIVDIGPGTAVAFAKLAHGASTIVWNGPMGKFEDARFMPGTAAIANAIADSGARSIVGGGDTISAVDSLGLLEKFTFVSTGGGAMLAFLAGQPLPGLEALGYLHD